MGKSRNFGKGRLKLDVINKAAYGDSDSMEVLLRHYEPYILRLSTIYFYDEDGNVHPAVNVDLKNLLVWIFITTVMRYTFKYTE